MSKTEILAELSNLKAEERQQVFQRLCELQDEDLLHGAGPTLEEREMLDQALAEFTRDGDIGIPWRETMRQLRMARAS
jgi:hypothetical protein